MTHMIHKRIVRFGEYSTKKERDTYCKDLRDTHFRLGTDGENGITSYVYDYRRFGPDADANEKDPVISARLLAKKDFQLGTDRDDPASSYRKDYGPKNAGNAGLDKDLIKDLRATHYALGHDPRSFETIHKQDYVDLGRDKRDPKDISNMRTKMRMQNFKFGDDPTNYKSSTADAYAKRPPRAQPIKPADGTDIRKTHFVFGNDPKDYGTTSGLQFAHGKVLLF